MNGNSSTRIRHRMAQQNNSITSSTSITEKPDTRKGGIICLILTILFILYYIFIYSANNYQRTLKESSSIHSTFRIETNPSKTSYINTEYMYQFPNGVEPEMSKGIIFFAHGCSHSSTDFFSPSIDCPHCLGLPEERALIKYFLNSKFIVITISSQNRDSKCWQQFVDTEPVKKILLHFKKQYNLNLVPLYAFGASSGGTFVGSLATNINFIDDVGLDGVIIQISAINIGYDDLPFNIFIPVLFVPMTKDQRIVSIVNRELEILQKNGDTISKICEIQSTPIGELYFYRQIGDNMLPEVSKLIYKGLQNGGYLDDDDYLIEDPRQSNWRYAVRSSVGQDGLNQMFDTLVADESAISEEMNVAYAMHELAAQCKPEMIEFINSIEKSKLFP